jgi:uncharacterized membrane protein
VKRYGYILRTGCSCYLIELMCCNMVAWIIHQVRERPLIFFAFLHAILFLAASANLDQIVGNCGIERQLAVRILDGQMPYSDFFTEYPPLAILSYLLPALLSATQPWYSFLFALEMLLLDLVVLFLMVRLASRFNMRMWQVLGIYTLCLLAIGPVVTGRYDLLPATLVLLALYAFISGRNGTAWVVLALGVMAKIYPIIIAPFFVLYLLRYRQYRRLAQGIVVLLAVVSIISLPWLVMDADGYWQSIGYHLERGLHIESSYGSVLLVGQILGLTKTTGEFSYGSWNLSSPMADNLAQASTYITIGLLLLAYALYTRRLWRRADAIAPPEMTDGVMASLLRYSLLAIVIMLLGSKLFSPQFIIWLCPLLSLVVVRWRYALAVLFLLIGGITQYIYPHHYLELEMVVPYIVISLAVRNFLLLAMAVILLLPLRNKLQNREQEVIGLLPAKQLDCQYHRDHQPGAEDGYIQTQGVEGRCFNHDLAEGVS